MDLLAARCVPSFRRIEAVLLGFYLAFAGLIAACHEPWTDEAQAWLLARENGLGTLLLHRLHYEGTPGLWHLLLWLLCRLHFSYGAMHGTTVLLGGAAAFLILRSSPFPPLVRWLLPFSVALAYQIPIVARSYSLVPLFAFALCALFSANRQRPWLVALMAGLLANTSLVAAFLAAGLALYFFIAYKSQEKIREKIPAVAIFAGLCLFAIYTALPAPDTSEGQARALAANPRVAAVLGKLTGSAARCSAGCPSAGSCQPATGNNSYHPHPKSKHGGPWLGLVHIASLAFFPISNFNLLALGFYVALLVWQWKHKALLCSLPLVAVLLGAKILPFNEHHTAVFWTAIVATLWLTWARIAPKEKSLVDGIFIGVLLAVLVQQIAWTAFAARYDLNQPYDGSAQAAQFLIDNAGGRAVAGFNYHSIGLEPYVVQKLYTNQETTYWPWSCAADSDAKIHETLASKPAFVVAGESYDGDVSWRNQIVKEKPAWVRNDEDGIAEDLQAHGYRSTHRFCGQQPAQFGFSEKTCELIYEPVGSER
jgi:hypothetical protein